MTSANALAYFRGDYTTRIVADAGPDELGAVLLQLHGRKWRVVSYASRNYTEVERHLPLFGLAKSLISRCMGVSLS